ncbi:glycosyltransferase [Actinoplanes sp. L3-i22]|uniref:glycosyltransferase n=1 Tax=Actinoplanes sp. L3-i22 TaxID=2836373 RepID=UPI001C799FE0|nr:glycosyltransferase [Actinoplanes sp. L3-i22]BCY13846.1 hypothetical protein L3i22_089340 [Actinoplanes sp. L3-i22]
MSVVIPAGTAALPVLLAALPAVHEVIVVVGRDDDTTIAVPRAARVIRQTRTGVGNALACGVAAGTGDIVVTLPGDGTGDPAELPGYLRALRAGADVAQGTRFPGGAAPRFGERMVLWLMAVLFGVRRSDPGFGIRAFWRDSAGAIGFPRVSGLEPVRGDGVEIEPLLTVRAGVNGLLVTEVPAGAAGSSGAAPGAGAGLVEAGSALIGEYFARRSARAGETDSIVVMTGREPAAQDGVLRRTGTDHHLINPVARARAAAPRAADGDIGPGLGRRGFSPASPFLNASAGGGASSSGGDAERRLGGRGAGGGAGRTLGEVTTVRRQWRDSAGGDVGGGRRRMPGRPNLRVINGEGDGGGASSRTGKLRSVPPQNLDNQG